jgi:hypothetical protein
MGSCPSLSISGIENSSIADSSREIAPKSTLLALVSVSMALQNSIAYRSFSRMIDSRE